MRNIGAEFGFLFLMLGVASLVAFVLHRVFGGGGGIIGFLLFLMVVVVTVREAPVASYLFTATVGIAIGFISSKDKRPLHLLEIIMPSLVLAAVICGGLYFVGGLLGSDTDGDRGCTRAAPQFC